MTLTVGSLCSGIGGLELGIERALGARTVWQSEVDPNASTVLAARWPGVPNHGDLRSVDWSSIEPVDVMCFGFPCQDISHAGRGAGLEGERSGLWFDCADAVRLVGPRYLLVENVGALLVRGFGRVLADLAEMGYVGRWGCLRSSDVGAPHRRERVFVAAAHADGGRTGRDGRAVPRASAGDRRPGVDVRPPLDGCAAPADAQHDGRHVTAFSRGAGESEEEGWLLEPEGCSGTAADTQDERHERTGVTRDRRTGPAHRGPTAPNPNGDGLPRIRSDEQRTGQGPRTDPDRRDGPWGDYGPAVHRWEAVHGQAPNPRDELERLNPALPEWMLGFPAGWVTDLDLPRTAQLRVLGNAVQPQVAEAAVRLLLLPLIGQEAAA